MQFAAETRQEEDGRWLAEIPDLPGVSAVGETPEAAIIHAQALALHTLADGLPPEPPASHITYVPYAPPEPRQADSSTQEVEPWPVKAVSLLLNFGTLF